MPNHLLVSFKKESGGAASPEMFFSDSFNSNQKHSPQSSPHKNYKMDIDVIEERSVSLMNTEKSKSAKTPSEKQIFNSSYIKEANDYLLQQQSNQRSQLRPSQISDYYANEGKYSGSFRKEPTIVAKNNVQSSIQPGNNDYQLQ